MTLTVQSLAELDTDKVVQARDYISQLLQEENEAIDLKRGVLHDLLLHLSGILAAAQQTNIDRVRQSSSLLAIEADPTLAEDDVVDRVLSNYRLTRIAGSAAAGTVTIVVDTLAPVTVPSGAVFSTDGQEFITLAPISAVESLANVTSDTDRVLTPRGDGSYSFTVDVSAVEAGAAGQVRRNTLMVPDVRLNNYVTSYATSDFTGGVDTETNSELLLRLQEGSSCKALSNRGSMYALLRESFPSYVSSSIVGFGDPELIRDQHSILPVSFGGRVDWYVRTQELPQSIALTKTATLIDKSTDGRGTWQFAIDRDEAPGFYDVTEIKTEDATNVSGSYSITSDVRTNDVTNISGQLTPDLESADEGAYSRWQTAIIQFYDSDTDTAGLVEGTSEQDYTVAVAAMPDIAEIQALVGSRANRNYGGDVLVRAPIPAFLSVAFTIQGTPGELLPDASAIRLALATYVNRLGFCGRLSASALSDIIHDHLTGRIVHSAIDMFAQVRYPDGTIVPLRSTEVLIVPSEPGSMVTARTVAFILDPNDVVISAETVNVPEI